MTENQRNYLADLAGQKGIRLSDTNNWPVAKASEEIERLKTLPDATFEEITPAQEQEISRLTENIFNEMNKWGFVRGKA